MEQGKQSENPTSQNAPSVPTPPASSNKPPQQPPPSDPQTGYDKLKEQYRLAIDMRLMHYPYRVISKRLKATGHFATEMTLETWFAKGGKCNEAYTNMRDIRTRELAQQIEDQKRLVDQGTSNALIIINRALEDAVASDKITADDYANARDMLDRGGIPKQTKTDVNGKIESEGVKEMAGLIKAVLESKSKGLPLPELKDESE